MGTKQCFNEVAFASGILFKEMWLRSECYCPLLVHLLILCLSQPGGDASELFSCCGDEETARTVRLLKSPETVKGLAPDAFADKRPILAVVKRGRYNNEIENVT